MILFTRKNTLIILAAILVVSFGYMAISLTQKKSISKPSFETEIEEIESQSTSNNLETIEKDLIETELSDLDKELQDIEKELNQAI